MTCRNTFLFIPRNGILCPQFFGIYLFHPLDIAKTESFLGGFAPPATWANHRSVFNGIRFYSCQNIVSTKTQQGMFRVTRNLLGYSQRPCHKWMYFSPKLRNNKNFILQHLFCQVYIVSFTVQTHSLSLSRQLYVKVLTELQIVYAYWR